MTQRDSSMYGAQGTPMPLGAHAWERVPLHAPHDAQPSFAAASNQSLPSALGLPASTTAHATNGHDSASAISPPFSSASSSSSSWLRYPSGGSSSAATYNGTLSSYDSSPPPPPTPQDSSLIGVQQRFLGGRRPGTAGDSASMAAAAAAAAASTSANVNADGKDGAGNNMRNFLIPIGSTGARQKLSILSASQRPRTAQPAANSPSPYRATSTSADHSASNVGGGEGTEGLAEDTSRIATRRGALQRSDTDLTSLLRRYGDDDAEATTGNGLRSRSTSQSTRSTTAEPAYSSTNASSSSRAGYGAGTATRIEGGSGAGYSPQLAHVLAGQPSTQSLSSAAADAPQASSTAHPKKGLYHLRREASQTSLSSLSAGMAADASQHAAPSSGERLQGARVGSHGGSASMSSGLVSHPPQSFEDAQVATRLPASDGDADLRPRSSSSTAKDFTGSLKSGLKNVFQRGGARGARPATASAAAADGRGGGATGLQKSNSSASMASATQPARTFSGSQTDSHGHARVPSFGSSTGAASKAERILGIVPTQQAGEASRSSSMSSNSTFTPAHHPRSPDESLQSSPVENTFDASSRPRGAIGARRPSRDHLSPSARPGTAPGLSTPGPYDAFGDDQRSKTPVPPAPYAAYDARRPSDASSESSKRAATSYGMAGSFSTTSIASLLDAHGRRGSAASDASTPTLRNAAGSTDGSKRTDASSTTISPSSSSSSRRSDSVYSAPNSSRSLSPTNPDKPSVPLTSPLLASVLALQASPAPFAAPARQQKQHSADMNRSTSLSSSISSIAGSEDDVADVPTTASVTTSPHLKPALPAKSKSRTKGIPMAALNADEKAQRKVSTPTKLDPDATPKMMERKMSGSSLSLRTSPASATLTGAAVPSSPVPSASPTSVSSFATVQQTDQPQTDSVDPRVFVPADALKRNRRGVPVRGRSKDDDEKAAMAEAAVASASSTEQLGASATSLNGSYSLPALDSLTSPLIPSSVFDRSAAVVPGDATGAEAQSVPNATAGQIISFSSADYETYGEGDSSIDTVSSLPASAWAEIDSALLRFKAIPAQSINDKGTLLRAVLLPFLALEAETPETRVSGSGTFASEKSRRSLFFEWIRHLLLELQTTQTSADRGAILESIACIVESRNFSAPIVAEDKDDEQTFFGVLGHILGYAIGELNKKGVYQNTLIFSGRLLAVAFFRIEGVASKLLRALPVNRFALERVATEAHWQDNVPSDWDAFKRQFPSWLLDFCFEDARSYLKMLDAQPSQPEDDDRFLVRQANVEVEMTGNWLRRWQSDDSELFFSFCRSYHRQLAGVLTTKRPNGPMSAAEYNKLFFGGPGFAHLATCIHQKCLSLVHRDILSVTTLSSQKNFNPGETANVLSGSTAGKPRHLEAANRRCTAIVVDIVRMAPASTVKLGLFAQMLGIHIKCLVKRTSLYDVQGVFCLLDWLDGVLGHMENAEMVVSDFVDVDFLLHTISLLLKDADHALALMRTIAFCYSNFAILTGTKRHRQRFFEQILLQPAIFQKLFLSWSFTIRAYFLHLLVFRLARINDFDNPADDPRGKTSVRVVKLFSRRLDEIRRRHDELSPQPSSTDSQSDEEDDFTRFKRRPQSFVSTIRHTPSVHKMETSPAITKAERVLGIGMPDPVLSSKGESKAQSRAAKWLRALGGKGSNKNASGNVSNSSNATTGQRQASISSSSSRGSISPVAGGLTDTPPKIFNEPRGRLPRLDELDLFSDEDEDDDGSMRGARHRRLKARQRGGDEGEGEDEEGDSEDDDDDEDDDDEDEAADERNSLELNATPRSTSQDGFEFSFEGRPGHSPKSADAAGLSPKAVAASLAPDAPTPTGEHISPDMSFDLQTPMSSFAATGGTLPDSSAADPSQHRVSRAFSRRQSLLPGPAYSLVNGDAEEDGTGGPVEPTDDDSSSVAASLDDAKSRSRRPTPTKNAAAAAAAGKRTPIDKDAAPPYARHLHIYAVQSLREYEQTVQEHDDFFSSQQDNVTPQVPRLPIQWPAMWSE